MARFKLIDGGKVASFYADMKSGDFAVTMSVVAVVDRRGNVRSVTLGGTNAEHATGGDMIAAVLSRAGEVRQGASNGVPLGVRLGRMKPGRVVQRDLLSSGSGSGAGPAETEPAE